MSYDEPRLIDVLHLGHERVIGAWLVDDVIVDPGPQSSMATLLEALGDVQPRALALTHIHLDHAGAAGSLVARWPDLEVWVHERGAPHLADPTKLLASATRLYGADMERLWGEFLAVPQANLRVLRGGEKISGFDVAYTPGHASHHVSYLHRRSGSAFVGDVGGVRIRPEGYVLAPTPPPDIDLDAWRGSLSVLRDWDPARLIPTHFGAWDDVASHLDLVAESLEVLGTRARLLDCDAFAAKLATDVLVATSPASAAAYLQGAPFDQCWQGLQRYWSKRGGISAPSAL